MLLFTFFIICFFASSIGAICGIGGGVIIKPVLDAFHVMDVASISFLSGCTVLSMSACSVIKSRISGNSKIEQKTGLPLALGAAVGGTLGKWIFEYISDLCGNQNSIGAIQAVCLFLVTLGTLIYTLCKNRISTHHVTHLLPCSFIGIFLGLLSSFLGIGGGPINLVILFFFFSMDTKTAAENSLYIIFFSQAASLITTLATGSFPPFRVATLLLMILGGIGGCVCGRKLNSRISVKTVDKLFIGLMIVIICISLYNIYTYTY